MLTITPLAAEQIIKAAQESNMQALAFRVEARRNPSDQSIEYLIGFDEAKDGDVKVDAGEITVVFNHSCEELLKGTTIDFDDIEGEPSFIFMNPNDPHYVPPKNN